MSRRTFILLLFALITAPTVYAQSNQQACAPGFRKAGHQNKTSIPYEVKLINAKDGRVIATDASSVRLEPRWLKATFHFRPSGGAQNAYFKAGDLLREDGRYLVRVSINNKPYGEYPSSLKVDGSNCREGKCVRRPIRWTTSSTTSPAAATHHGGSSASPAGSEMKRAVIG